MKKLGHILKNLFLGIIQVFIYLFFPKRNKKKYEKKEFNTQKQNIIDKNKLNNNTSEDSDSDNPRELFKEFISSTKITDFDISDKEIKEIFNKAIEKVFKIEITKISKQDKEKLKEYSKKKIVKVKEDINKGKIKNQEDLQLSLEKIIKKDHIEKEQRKENIKNSNVLEKENLNNLSQNKVFIQKQIINKKISPIKPKKSMIFSKPIINNYNVLNQIQTNLNQNVDEIVIPEKKCGENFSKTVEEFKTPNFKATPDSEKIVNSSVEDFFINENTYSVQKILDPEEKITLECYEDKKNVNELSENTINIVEQKELEKSEIKKDITDKNLPLKKVKPQNENKINYDLIFNNNNLIIEKANSEINKEDFIDKEYDYIETLINEKITDLEKLLYKIIDEKERKQIKKELSRLVLLKQKVHLHKDIDLENIRVSLEESISYEELLNIKRKLKVFHDNTNLKEKEILFENIENKSQEEINLIKKRLIKRSFKNILKPLDFPLFLGFPFIKNRFFRKLVSGLFVFRNFQFIKNILFDKYEEEDFDFSSIQNGRDALLESIKLTEKNMANFNELKKSVLIKYPELIEDEEFLNYISILEHNLQRNYERLLKHEKVVNKYFSISKKLIRKKNK